MQNVNPLFPTKDGDQPKPDLSNSYILPKQQPVIPPVSGSVQSSEVAADLIRQKLAHIYAQEPDPLAEEREAQVVKPRSKHQQFMYQLSTSGKSLADIQTDWHNYYATLSDREKHEVWQEFYEDYAATQPDHTYQAYSSHLPQPRQFITHQTTPVISAPHPGMATTGTVDSALPLSHKLRNKLTAGGRLKTRHHLQSLGFGLGVGLAVIVIFMFSFFNEVIIAPFIQPSRTVSATPIIIDPASVTTSNTPQVIIPKINVDIPVDFSETSTNEAVIENDLNSGIVHYPTTVLPGQLGNTAYFGHSSNNIFNPGKYKFAFVLLHTMQPGDTFYIVFNGQIYIYKVFENQIVSPNDVAVLGNVPGHTATATLITCDPPGTSINRLIVVGDQISPAPTGNSGGNNTSASLATSTQLPGNGPTLWSRLWNWLF